MDGGRGFNTALGTGFGVEIWHGGGAIGGGRCFGMEVGMGQGAGLRHVGGVIGGGQAYWGSRGGMVAMQGAWPGGQKCCGGVACWAWLNVMGVWPIVGVAIANHAPFRCCTSRKQSLAPPPPGRAFSCALAPPPWTRWVLR